MKAVVVASGELDPADALYLDGADLTIAADGGAASLDGLGRTPQLLIGDLDSVDVSLVERLERGGTRVERHPLDKEASDTELAVEAAFAAGAAEVTLLGAAGGERLDHELANLLLVADAAFAGLALRAVRGASRVTAVHGGQLHPLDGRPGDLVTLLPVSGDASGVTTAGLRWSLDAATLAMGRSRGLSNEIVSTPASVRLEKGVLLLIETARRGPVG